MKVAVLDTTPSYTPSMADDLYSADPAVRRSAARALGRRGERAALRRVADWPADSPGAVNAWVLLVTTKPPNWRAPLLLWKEEPPTFGTPHAGFFYPDPLGFWTEVRRWITVLVRSAEPSVGTPDALSVAALVHVGDQPERATWARRALQPSVVLFLDEASWSSAEVAADVTPLVIPDPHRAGVVYEGCWGRTADGVVVGKAPQHPAAHLLYRSADMEQFLRAIPFVRI
jgi:hypothetical protein